MKTVLLYGLHPCIAALNNPKRKILKVYSVDKNIKNIDFKNYKVNIVKHSQLDSLVAKGSPHQGIVMEVERLENCSLKSLYNEELLLVLDQVTDPHNVGAIIRSSVAFGVNGIIIPKDNSIEETPALAKSACGALEKISICKVTNLARCLDDLKKEKFWITALDGNCDNTIDKVNFSGKNILVLGAEGKGLRKLTKQKCDDVAKLPISHEVESLNVSNAAAIAMYEISKQL